MNAPPGSLVLRNPTARWLGSYFSAALSLLLGLPMLGVSVWVALQQAPAVGAFVALIAGFMLWLSGYAARDAYGKQRLLVEANTTGLRLRLPPGRSLIHHEGWVRRDLVWTEIEAIETRLEAYSTLGMANMQRTFSLRLHGGEHIFVGEDRALGTNLETHTFADFAGQLSERFELPVLDGGMTEGKAGALGVAFTKAPGWDAAPANAQRQRLLWRRVARTSLLVALAPLVVLLIGLLGR